ncbi:PEGA domain-containing protein [Archangium sp.]|uniref:PEGA domain-containing protein n=1 Tax=Archangium sp. TaxID=1872627 RepID=UPI002D5BDAFB|nr:PEGA domain-containing protein [Archangium sp.]HYO51798.1 PEGA domain-containing protein [Archangium sp.]
MNRSRLALTLSAALLVLWAAPADAQRPRAKQRTGAVQQPVSKKRNGTKQLLRTRQRPGARQQPISAQPPAPEQPVSVQPPAPEQPVPAQPPAPERQQASGTLEASGDRPWAKGISKEDQALVVELFETGNTLLKESIFVQAAESYRKALEHWDHPAIHYNLALALMNLDQPIEVHEHLVAAMRYGPEPLENEKFEYARNYKTLIEKQLARVEIACDLPGATVTLDGKTLFVGPGRHEGLVRVGTHSIIALKEGYLPTEKSRTLMPGEQVTLDLKLYTSDQVTQYRRRWPAWTPWVVMGSGLAVAAGGGLLHLETSKSYSAFDAGITERCLSGCERAPDDLAAMKARGDLMQKAAMGAYSIGGAALLTGAVLFYLNQPQAYRIDPDQGDATVDVTPLLSGDTNGVLATFRF